LTLVLRKLCGETLPAPLIPAPLEARDDPPLRVDHDHVRLVVGAERAGALAVTIGDRGPRPAVAIYERASLVRRVGDVEPEIRVLGM
jgi:hypothetical protein